MAGRPTRKSERVQSTAAPPDRISRAADNRGVRTPVMATSIIGAPFDRIDGRLKVTGGATYAAEFKVPNLVHAVLVQSTVGAGTITGLDLREAQGLPGV